MSPNAYDGSLLLELKAVNASFAQSHPQTKASAKEIAIVSADAKGAWTGAKGGTKIGVKVGAACGSPLAGAICGGMLGGLIVGAFESYLTHELASSEGPSIGLVERGLITDAPEEIFDCIVSIYQQHNSGIEMETINNDHNLFVSTKIEQGLALNENAIKVGKMHNVILAGLNEEIPIDNSIALTKSGSFSPMVSLENQIINESEFKNMFLEIEEDYGLWQENNEINGSMPAAVMELFNDVFMRNTSNAGDIAELINEYSRLIMNSNELTEEEKEWIQAGLSVSLYSFKYWSDKGSISGNE